MLLKSESLLWVLLGFFSTLGPNYCRLIFLWAFIVPIIVFAVLCLPVFLVMKNLI